MENQTDVLAVHAIPVIVQEEDIVCPAPNCHEQNGGLPLNATQGSRPSSQLSQNGSSGYGSTRSQVGPFGTSNRPSPASSSSSSSSTSGSTSNSKTANNNNNSNKPKRSVWFGNSSMRSQRAVSAEPEPETVMSETGNGNDRTVTTKTRGGPQYASLRIPNRISHHGGSHGELNSFEDRGLDLAEAEVDSDVDVENRVPMPAPRGHPLRHSSSLEAQVRIIFIFIYPEILNRCSNRIRVSTST